MRSPIYNGLRSSVVSHDVPPPPPFNIQNQHGLHSMRQVSNNRVATTEALRGSVVAFAVPYCVTASKQQYSYRTAAPVAPKSLELVCSAEVIGRASATSYTHLHQQNKQLNVDIIYPGGTRGRTPRGCHFKALCIRLPDSACVVR